MISKVLDGKVLWQAVSGGKLVGGGGAGGGGGVSWTGFGARRTWPQISALRSTSCRPCERSLARSVSLSVSRDCSCNSLEGYYED